MIVERCYCVQVMGWLMKIVDYTGLYLATMDLLLPSYTCKQTIGMPNITATICAVEPDQDYVNIYINGNDTIMPKYPIGHVIGHLLSNFYYDLLMQNSIVCAIHSAVFIRGHSAILAVGKSHSGKSYLCKEAVARYDINCLSDDFAIIRSFAPKISIENVFKPIYLRNISDQEAQQLKKYYNLIRCKFHDEEKDVLLNYKKMTESSFDIEKILFLSRETNTRLDIQHLKSNDIYVRLLHNLLTKDIDTNRKVTKFISNSVECLSCVYSEADELLETIFRQ